MRSKLADWLSVSPQHVATAQQWLAMLRNQNSLRREEIERSGILGTVQIRVPLRYRHSLRPITQRLQLIAVFRLA